MSGALVQGAGHSWSSIARPVEYQMSLDNMKRVLAVDTAQSRITVQAGIRLFELIEVCGSVSGVGVSPPRIPSLGATLTLAL